MAAKASSSAIAQNPEEAARRVLAGVGRLPGGRELLELARERDGIELVGGATRDLLRETEPRELDVVVESDAAALARELARAIGLDAAGVGAPAMSSGVHERFGTAFLSWEGGRIDIAARRSESYPAPGALPEVRAGSAEEDLQRRDFTVNAIAISLGGSRRGELRSVSHALEDLSRGRLRVLHDQSFHDDPTRLLRLARYGARLAFELEERTADLARAALAAGALQTVSRARIGAELRLALCEPAPPAALLALAHLGVLEALDPPLGIEEQPARGALAALPEGGRSDLLLLACLLLSLPGPERERERIMRSLLDDLEFPASDRDRAIATALRAPELARSLADVSAPSRIRAAMGAAPLEAAALAAALPGASSAARQAAHSWLSELRHVALHINGDDLLAAGVPEGPEIGRRLQAALDMRLDGQLEDSREAQLRAALEAAP